MSIKEQPPRLPRNVARANTTWAGKKMRICRSPGERVNPEQHLIVARHDRCGFRRNTWEYEVAIVQTSVNKRHRPLLPNTGIFVSVSRKHADKRGRRTIASGEQRQGLGSTALP